MNISVVTSAWGSYGRFLPDWLESIEQQTVRPDKVVIVDAGLDDDLPLRIKLGTFPIPWRLIKIPYQGFGHARNTAVGATDTPWVMHLDADDVLTETAIEDAAMIEDQADVIAFSAIRNGALVNLSRTSRNRVLSGNLACYSCSPFRRELWERRPYITANNWVDSALWIGFAHMGARFVGTKRAGFVYRQHPGSYSKLMTREEKRAAMAQFFRLLEAWPS